MKYEYAAISKRFKQSFWLNFKAVTWLIILTQLLVGYHLWLSEDITQHFVLSNIYPGWVKKKQSSTFKSVDFINQDKNNVALKPGMDCLFLLCFTAFHTNQNLTWCYLKWEVKGGEVEKKSLTKGFLAHTFKPTPAIKYLFLQSGKGGRLD